MAPVLLYSCLENSMDRGAWQSHKESDPKTFTFHSFRQKEIDPR